MRLSMGNVDINHLFYPNLLSFFFFSRLSHSPVTILSSTSVSFTLSRVISLPLSPFAMSPPLPIINYRCKRRNLQGVPDSQLHPRVVHARLRCGGLHNPGHGRSGAPSQICRHWRCGSVMSVFFTFSLSFSLSLYFLCLAYLFLSLFLLSLSLSLPLSLNMQAPLPAGSLTS